MSAHFKFSPKKAQAAVAYLARKKVPELTTGKICKLLFLADRFHLVQFGRPVTGDTYFALEHGPVPTAVYNLLKPGTAWYDEFVQPLEADQRFRYWRYSLRPDAQVDFDLLSKSDQRALDETIRRHGRKSFAELRALTHEMPEWKKAWDQRRAEDKQNAQMLFEDFFDDDEDAVEGVLDEILEKAEIAQALSAH